MALSITDSQNTKVYLAAEGTAVGTVTEIETAISGGKQIGCLNSLGEISSTRNVQEYACLSSNETAKALGSLTLGNLPIELLFDSQDAAGQADLRDAYANNTRRVMIIELNDNAGTSPTYITFDAGISGETTSIQKDNAVLYTATVEIASTPVFTMATV